MQLGMIGLGRMGANLVRRLMRDGHECVVYDVSADAVEGARGRGRDRRDVDRGVRRRSSRSRGRCGSWCRPRSSTRRIDELVAASRARATSSSTAATRTTATTSTAPRASSRSGIHYVDVGTSGGVFGLDRGFCLMIGGEDDVVAHLDPIFATIAPGVDAAPRTPGRTGDAERPPRTATCTAARTAPATS